MPRQARVVAVDVPHHITHRGNNRQDVFLTDEDRCRYQELLLKSLEPCRVELLGWCWMSNHVHLVVVPRREDSLSRLIRRVHSAYAQDFNRRRSRDGHVWRKKVIGGWVCARTGKAHASSPDNAMSPLCLRPFASLCSSETEHAKSFATPV